MRRILVREKRQALRSIFFVDVLFFVGFLMKEHFPRKYEKAISSVWHVCVCDFQSRIARNFLKKKKKTQERLYTTKKEKKRGIQKEKIKTTLIVVQHNLVNEWFLAVPSVQDPNTQSI